MTLTLAPDAPPRSSPLAALMAAVHPEHRADLLTPHAGHPRAVRGPRRPLVPGPPAWCRLRLLAPGPPAALHAQACLVPGCRFGRHRSQLSHHHYATWAAAAHHGSVDAWAAAVRVEPADQSGCGVPACELWTSFDDGFSASRTKAGSAPSGAAPAPVPGRVPRRGRARGDARIDLTRLAPQLKLEVQYVVQCSLDHGPRRVNLSRWNAVVRALHAHGAATYHPSPHERRVFLYYQATSSRSSRFKASSFDSAFSTPPQRWRTFHSDRLW